MAKQRVVNTKFWDDKYIRSLTPNGKLLFIYLITNPLTTIAGAYEITLDRIIFDTGLKGNIITDLLLNFEAAGKTVYREDWILVVNSSKHQSNSPKILKGIEIALNDCPDWIKDRVLYGIDTSSHLNPNSNTKSNSNTNSKKPDTVRRTKTAQPQTAEELLAECKAKPEYENLNVDREFFKAVKWIDDHPGREFNKRFFINWLSKADVPIKVDAPKPTGPKLPEGHPPNIVLNDMSNYKIPEIPTRVVDDTPKRREVYE